METRSEQREADVEGEAAARPRLLFFYSEKSGRCCRVEGFLALLLQRRRNHRTFNIIRVRVEEYPGDPVPRRYY